MLRPIFNLTLSGAGLAGQKAVCGCPLHPCFTLGSALVSKIPPGFDCVKYEIVFRIFHVTVALLGFEYFALVLRRLLS